MSTPMICVNYETSKQAVYRYIIKLIYTYRDNATVWLTLKRCIGNIV